MIIGPSDPIPTDRFIYAIYDTGTGELGLGYSNATPTSATRRVATRLPGHTQVMVDMKGWSEAQLLEAIDSPVLTKRHLGKQIGGGFVLTDDAVNVHPFNSFKAAGQLEPFVDPLERSTINPMRKSTYGFSAMAPPEDFELIAKAVVKRTGLPIKVTREFDGPMFPWNTKKQGLIPIRYYENVVGVAGDSFDQMAWRVNSRELGPFSGRMRGFSPVSEGAAAGRMLSRVSMGQVAGAASVAFAVQQSAASAYTPLHHRTAVDYATNPFIALEMVEGVSTATMDATIEASRREDIIRHASRGSSDDLVNEMIFKHGDDDWGRGMYNLLYDEYRAGLGPASAIVESLGLGAFPSYADWRELNANAINRMNRTIINR